MTKVVTMDKCDNGMLEEAKKGARHHQVAYSEAPNVTITLNGTDYVTEAGVRELRKANKDATEKTWEIVEKWTPAKVGRYFRLAIIAKQELNK